MTGREIILKALRNETTPRPAWIPFVGVHGGKLIGETASAYLQSGDLLLKGLLRACELYRPDALPIVFDLQMEAEVLGCKLQWSDQTPPAVLTHPLTEGRALHELPVFDTGQGRYPLTLEALRRLKKEKGGEVAIYGLICGPFTLTLHLMGHAVFMQMFDHPDYVKAVVGYCAGLAKKAARAYLEAGADVVAVVDPMTSQISAEHFDSFVASSLDDVFNHVRALGGISSLFVCGDASRNLEKMCRTACDNISIDENIPLEKVRDFTRHANKSFGGNLRLTSALLLGDEDDAKLDAIRCIDMGGGCGFVLAPGCDLPYATPEANLQAVAQMVHDQYQREVAKRTIIARSADEAARLDVPDYDRAPHVTLDVITLDSASCAPCQYMMETAHRAAKQMARPVVVKEHKITTREGLAMMMRLGVKNLPTICIDGRPRFVSLIPDQQTLMRAIEERQDQKGRR
jgi:uroporphyrinogen decarboxylase